MAIIKKRSTPISINSDAISVDDSLVAVTSIMNTLGLNYIPTDLGRLIQHYGITLIYEELSDDLSGYIEKRGNSFYIGINQYQSSRRQRFTLAHELGHFLMHKSKLESNYNRLSDKIILRANDSNIIEDEANEFDSNLLMPRDIFMEKIRNGVRNIHDLADTFEVSIAAVRYRAYHLQLIPEL